MKRLFALFLILISFQTAEAQGYRVYKRNGNTFFLPPARPRSPTLEGEGVIFTNNINIETTKDPLTGIEEKKAWLYVSGCGKVFISDAKIFEELKQGDMVNVRLTQVGQCTVKSWKKF